jgi:iron only hydrogenase large subunit-like protein
MWWGKWGLGVQLQEELWVCVCACVGGGGQSRTRVRVSGAAPKGRSSVTAKRTTRAGNKALTATNHYAQLHTDAD